MPTAIRKLGSILFVVGCVAVLAGLGPVAAGKVRKAVFIPLSGAASV